MGRTFAAWPSGQGFSRASVHDASAALHVARRFEDLLAKPPPGSPYDFAQLFATGTWAERRRSRRRFKLLKAVDPRLAYVLQPGERVIFLTKGSTLSPAENFFTDWAAYYLNLRALAFTDRRLILVQISVRQHPLESVAHIPYPAIAGVRAGRRGRSRLLLRNGHRLDITYTPRADQRQLRALLAGVLAKAETPVAEAPPWMQNLCPNCFEPVEGFPRKCSACGIRLRRPFAVGLLSLLFPGLGNWKLGCRGFASFELLVAAALWLRLVIAPAARVLARETEAVRPAVWVTVAIGLAVVHLADAAMTLHYARKGLRSVGD